MNLLVGIDMTYGGTGLGPWRNTTSGYGPWAVWEGALGCGLCSVHTRPDSMKIDVPLYGVGLVHVRAREVDTRCACTLALQAPGAHAPNDSRCQLEHGMLTAWLSGQALCTSMYTHCTWGRAD